jgi:hypothetical protein
MADEDKTIPLSNVITIDDERIRGHLDRVVRGTVEETLNALLDAEADRLCNARRSERESAATRNQTLPTFSTTPWSTSTATSSAMCRARRCARSAIPKAINAGEDIAAPAKRPCKWSQVARPAAH